MKRLLHALSGAIIFLTPMVWGFLLVYGNWLNTDFRDFIFDSLKASPSYGIGWGTALMLMVLLYLLTFGRPASRKRYISFESESGSVSISVNAVRDFVRKVGDEFGAVISLDPKIYPGKNSVSMDLNVKIQTGSKLPELSEMLQGRVRESIRDGLGIVEVRDVQVKVQEIVGVPPSSEPGNG